MTAVPTYDFESARGKRIALTERWERLKNDRQSWETHWSSLARYMMPRSYRRFSHERNRTDSSHFNDIYDNTATQAVRTLGSGMMAGASNPGRPWFKLTTDDPDLAQYHPVRLWLDDVVARMQRVFAKTNTYTTLHQMYEELGVFGTAVSVMVPHPTKVLHHYPVTCGQYCLQVDYDGQVVALFREFEKTVGEIVKEFGLGRCSLAVQESWADGNHEHTRTLLHVIEPRQDRARDPDRIGQRDMPWRSVYLERDSNEDERLLRESGFPWFPVLAPRWQVVGQDVYGQSPGMVTLGDTKSLQHAHLRLAQAIDYMVTPPVVMPSDMAAQFRRRGGPGGASYIAPGTRLFGGNDVRNSIRSAWEVNIDINALREKIVDDRRRIESGFYADLFLMLSLAGPDTRMTATEVAERHEEKLLALGPVLERLHNELLQPLIEQTFDIMRLGKMLPPAPPELQGVELDVEFVSILAQAQRAIGSNSIDRFVGNIFGMAAARPEILDNLDVDAYTRNYAQLMGVPSEILVDPADVEALRRSRAQAQAVQAQLEASNMQAATAKDLAAAPTTEGNVLGDVLSQAGAAL